MGGQLAPVDTGLGLDVHPGGKSVRRSWASRVMRRSMATPAVDRDVPDCVEATVRGLVSAVGDAPTAAALLCAPHPASAPSATTAMPASPRRPITTVGVREVIRRLMTHRDAGGARFLPA